MTKQKFGSYLQLGGYGALISAVLVAIDHPLIITFLLAGAAAFLFGRWLEKSV